MEAVRTDRDPIYTLIKVENCYLSFYHYEKFFIYTETRKSEIFGVCMDAKTL